MASVGVHGLSTWLIATSMINVLFPLQLDAQVSSHVVGILKVKRATKWRNSNVKASIVSPGRLKKIQDTTRE
jgi:hypothetical protein